MCVGMVIDRTVSEAHVDVKLGCGILCYVVLLFATIRCATIASL